MEGIPDCLKDDYIYFTSINKNRRKANGKIIYGEQYKIIKNSYIVLNGKQMPFQIICLTPAFHLIANSKLNSSLSLNDYSVSLIININDNNYIYGADIENNNIISLMKEDIFIKNMSFIKVPHHGSLTANKVFNIMDITEDTTCAITNYNNSFISLPDRELVEMYCAKSKEVFLFNDNNSDEEYGILKSVYIINSFIRIKS